MDKLYTIQEAAIKLGLSDKTLRRWEEAGKFTPSRTLGNQRRYSLEDLQILDAIKHGIIIEQKDLLTVAQAAGLCGVSPMTILHWEDGGKIHPLITSGNTYYPRQKLMEKMDELKRSYVEPAPVSLGSDLSQGTVPQRNSRLQAEKGSSADEGTVPIVISMNIRSSLIHALITLIILLCYHLLFHQPSVPARNATHSVAGGPASPQVQGASISTLDPRVDDLMTQFQTHLQSEILKDANPASLITTGTTTLLKNQNQVSVQAEQITPTTPVTVTFTSDYAPAKKYWVTVSLGSFTLHTDFPVSSDSAFNYSFLASDTSPSAPPSVMPR